MTRLTATTISTRSRMMIAIGSIMSDMLRRVKFDYNPWCMMSASANLFDNTAVVEGCSSHMRNVLLYNHRHNHHGKLFRMLESGSRWRTMWEGVHHVKCYSMTVCDKSTRSYWNPASGECWEFEMFGPSDGIPCAPDRRSRCYEPGRRRDLRSCRARRFIVLDLVRACSTVQPMFDVGAYGHWPKTILHIPFIRIEECKG